MTTIHISTVDATTTRIGDKIEQGGAVFQVVAVERDRRSSRGDVVRLWAVWMDGIGDYFMSRTTGTYVAPFRWELPAHMGHVVENRTGEKLTTGTSERETG